jgi:hypothetical protein
MCLLFKEFPQFKWYHKWAFFVPERSIFDTFYSELRYYSGGITILFALVMMVFRYL